jgi:2-phosphosulfolactate phosphatase
MKIEISEFIEGASRAKGLAVIIDVFRAFSVECYAIDSGAAKIIATDGAEQAFDLGKKYRHAVLAGEKDEKKITGFDFGNSPTEIIKADLCGKIFIHTTTAGTNGLINAVNADTVITGSFVNASATARYIMEKSPSQVSLVAMGYRAKETAEEDILCAEYIKSLIEGKVTDFDQRIADLQSTAGKRFFNQDNLDFSPPTDFFLCTMKDRFNFVLRAERRFDGNIDLQRIDI